MKRLSAVTAALAAATLAGCGGSGSDDAPQIRDHATSTSHTTGVVLAHLLDRIPGETRSIAAMDLALAKEQLHLPADTDPADYREHSSEPGADTFNSAALKLFGYLTGVGKTAASDAIDHGRAVAAVAAHGTLAEDLVIIATPQPSAEIERGLLRAGLKPVGESTFALENDESSYGLDVVALGDNLVILASSVEIAESVLRRSTPDPRVKDSLALLDDVRGALRVTATFRPGGLAAEKAPCVRAVAGGQRFEPAADSENLVVALTERPQPDRVILGTGAQERDILTRDYVVKHSSVEGQTLKIDVGTRPDALDIHNAATIADGTVSPEQIYRCPGARPVTPPPPAPRSSGAGLPGPAVPDASGSRLETAISTYIAAGSTAPTAVRVRCARDRAAPNSSVRCTGTRRYKGRLYHYKIVARFDDDGFKSVNITSPDDKTGTIVE